jgi:hypothetical protein
MQLRQAAGLLLQSCRSAVNPVCLQLRQASGFLQPRPVTNCFAPVHSDNGAPVHADGHIGGLLQGVRRALDGLAARHASSLARCERPFETQERLRGERMRCMVVIAC